MVRVVGGWKREEAFNSYEMKEVSEMKLILGVLVLIVLGAVTAADANIKSKYSDIDSITTTGLVMTALEVAAEETAVQKIEEEAIVFRRGCFRPLRALRILRPRRVLRFMASRGCGC